ncbi:MAG: SCP2 sterol-binding domain-containing protein [Thermoleophilaceae bacterium]
MGRRLQRRALRWFVRWVGRAPDKRLRRLMGGRIGARIIRVVKRAMRQRFNAERAGDLEAVVEFWVAGRRHGRSYNWQVVVEDGACQVTDELERDPDLTIEIDGVHFLKLVTANANGPALFLKGDLKLDGDLMLASRLPRLFRPARR